MSEELLSREQVKEAVADMKAAMDEMEMTRLAKAINKERMKTDWGQHPVNIRLSIPLFFTRIYLVFVAGQDQRSKARIQEDRQLHPLIKPGNLLVALAATIALTLFSTLL